jgi:hypothetical protein
MKLGLSLNYAGRHLSLPLDLVAEAEQLGFEGRVVLGSVRLGRRRDGPR